MRVSDIAGPPNTISTADKNVAKLLTPVYGGLRTGTCPTGLAFDEDPGHSPSASSAGASSDQDLPRAQRGGGYSQSFQTHFPRHRPRIQGHWAECGVHERNWRNCDEVTATEKQENRQSPDLDRCAADWKQREMSTIEFELKIIKKS